MALTNLGPIMDAIADATVSAGLVPRADGWPSDAIEPPCVVVGYPTDVMYDLTMANGADVATIPVYFVVGRTMEKAARDALSGVIAGAPSIKSALEASALGGIVDSVRVIRMDVVQLAVGTLNYVAARFTAEVVA